MWGRPSRRTPARPLAQRADLNAGRDGHLRIPSKPDGNGLERADQRGAPVDHQIVRRQYGLPGGEQGYVRRRSAHVEHKGIFGAGRHRAIMPMTLAAGPESRASTGRSRDTESGMAPPSAFKR